MSFEPCPLPQNVQRLCIDLEAPTRLVAHLTVVHDAAVEMASGLVERLPQLMFDQEAVLFGAATHDMGKVRHPNELTGPGSNHEVDGPTVLEQQGISSDMARFARTHGAWSKEELPLEDLLVALSDCVWKGQRLEPLEQQVVDRIASRTGNESWEVFSELDGLLEKIANQGDQRLAWQGSH